MTRNIVVEGVEFTPIEKQKVEIVERKGLGHPDYMADSIAETFSVNLSKYYINNFGRILHHNVDKLEIIGGKTVPEFGGGRIIAPVTVLFSGRATNESNHTQIPVEDIANNSAKEWISSHMRFLDPDKMRYIFETKSGSTNLSIIYERIGVLSNDTSFGVGFAPMSITEKLVLDTERTINSKRFKSDFPFTGEDVKVMGTREKKNIRLTLAIAFVDKFVDSLVDYFEKKDVLIERLKGLILEALPEDYEFSLTINGMDDRSLGIDGCYLTVTGTSAEHGDDGAVGRGNRVNGLITPNRVMSFEAIAGKNPVNHIGKIYNILAFEIANKIFKDTEIPVNVKIVGRIGDPIDQPLVVSVTSENKSIEMNKDLISRIVDDNMSSIDALTRRIIDGKVQIC